MEIQNYIGQKRIRGKQEKTCGEAEGWLHCVPVISSCLRRASSAAKYKMLDTKQNKKQKLCKISKLILDVDDDKSGAKWEAWPFGRQLAAGFARLPCSPALPTRASCN